MARKLLLLFFTLLSSFHTVEAQHFWMRQGGGVTIDEGIAIATDANGNSYSTGYFTTNATFGTTTLHAAGSTDIYMAKLNYQGRYSWVVSAGGTDIDHPTAIKADAIGNSYVTGYFYGTAHFGTHSITSAGIQDIFIAKYDSGGTCLWARSCGGASSDIGNSIAVDNGGNVLVTGQFKDSAWFGNILLVSMDSSIDVFTAKLDANGNFLWAKKGSSRYTDRGIGVVCDPQCNVYVTGQFSDTIAFDNVYDNQMYNAVFLVKYDSNGVEQWFRRAGGGGLDIPRSIAVDSWGNPMICGDFQGDLTFFDCPNNTILNNVYFNKIFLAKFNSNGNLMWSVAHGSDAEFTVKNLAVDRGDNTFLIGNFDCRLNEYEDHYGQGTFNSIGYSDIFVSKWTTSGAWLWSRQFGGPDNDNGAGIAIDTSQQPIVTGSFYQQLFIPVRYSNFLGYNGDSIDMCTNVYCNDTCYREYESWHSYGNSDAFIARAIDPARQPYDFYQRTDTLCNRNVIGVKISNNNTDTVQFCISGNLYTQSGACYYLGPKFTYLWSTGATTTNLYSVTTTGWYSVTQTSADGCFESKDSMYVIIHYPPNNPTITDDQGINNHALITHAIILCPPHPVLLTAGGFNNVHYQWINGPMNDSTITATHSGIYNFVISDSFGCSASNTVLVVMDSALKPIDPHLRCIQDTFHTDTISLCSGSFFSIYVFDSLTNPAGNILCSPLIAFDPYSNNTNPNDPLIYWYATPNTIGYYGITSNCFIYPYDGNTFYPTQSALYTITATIIRATSCDSDTIIISKNLFVNVMPIPTAAIAGNPFYCLGDSTLLYGTGGMYYTWNTPTNTGIHTDSISVSNIGAYSLTVTNAGGCSSTTSINVTTNPQPEITVVPASGLICPNDSALLICSGAGSFYWYGPNGPLAGNHDSIYASVSGIYYCILADTSGCILVSNDLEINQYNTPYIQALPNTIFCPGDSVQLCIITNSATAVQWNAPLSGNNLNVYVHAGGTYSCSINYCHIPTNASVTVVQDVPIASITSNPPVLCHGDSLVLHGNTGMTGYQWLPSGSNFINDTISQPGIYSLMTTDTLGCTALDSVTIAFANDSVSSSFSATPLAGCFPLAVNFSNASYNANHFLWYFGDGGSDTLRNPSHIYLDTGTYSIQLIAFNTNACGTFTDTVIINHYITIYPKAIAAFTADTMIGCVPFTVNFLNASTNSNSFLWNFGNLAASTLANPSYTYTVAGDYQVTLIASNAGGCNDTAHLNFISVINPPPVTSAFTADTFMGCNPLTVIFTDTGTYGTSYIWHFGDNTSSSTKNTAHTYSQAGIYSVQLITINDTSLCGRIADTTTHVNYIDVQDSIKVISRFIGNPLVGCIPLEIALTNNSSNGTTYYWDFGDGNSSSNPNPANVSYHIAGTYNLSLITSNPNARCASLPDTMKVEIIADSCYIIDSNFFTPNGDGINDQYNFISVGYDNYHLQIFNRWGQFLFESFQPKYRWDGRNGVGMPVPDGTYFYIFTATGADNKPIIVKGNITLIR